MSEKRKPAFEEHSEGVSGQEDNAKRGKLGSLRDTTLQDLPIELIECILVKAVAMEVMDMNLVKSVWKEKSDLVISRLSAVSPRWSSILTSDVFRNELHRTLDRTAEAKVKIEIVEQHELSVNAFNVILLRDNVFIYFDSSALGCYIIKMYNRNNMSTVKATISLQGINLRMLVPSSASNCLYCLRLKSGEVHSLSRIALNINGELGRTRMPRLSNMRISECPILAAHYAGGPILCVTKQSGIASIIVYNTDGCILTKIKLFPNMANFRNVISRKNGNLVLVYVDSRFNTCLSEINPKGVVVREYQSSLNALKRVAQADQTGTIIIMERLDRIELLDSEFNQLPVADSHLIAAEILSYQELHFDAERNEGVAVLGHPNYKNGVLSFFRLNKV